MAKSKTTTSAIIVPIRSAKRAAAPTSLPAADPRRSPEMVLITALLLQMREGNKASRKRFLAVRWQVGRGLNRYPDDTSFTEASRLIGLIDTAVADRESI